MKNKNSTKFWNKKEKHILDEMSLAQALRKANKLQAAGENLESKQIYMEILKVFPMNKIAKSNLKLIDVEQTQLSEQLTNPDQKHIDYIVNLFSQRKYPDALSLATKLIDQHPKSAILFNIVGAANSELGRSQDAISAYQSAIALEPKYFEAYNNLGIILKTVGDINHAQDAFENALSINPNYAEAHCNLGVLLQEKGDIDLAVQAHHKAISIKPSYATPHYNLGLILQENCRFDEAITEYLRAIELNPRYVKALFNLGNTFKEKKELDKALQCFQRALLIDPNYFPAQHNKASTLRDLGRLEEAASAYQITLKINPNDSNIVEEILSLKVQSKFTELSVLLRMNSPNSVSKVLAGSPKALIYNAIDAFIDGSYRLVHTNLHDYYGNPPENLNRLTKQDRRFCNAYGGFLTKLCQEHTIKDSIKNHEKVVYHLGDSHCLSFAHKMLRLQKVSGYVAPRIIFGAKAYHFSTTMKNRFQGLAYNYLNSIPNDATVLLSFGEIDCRADEGFIRAAKKVNRPLTEIIELTVARYVKWFVDQTTGTNKKLCFFNVPAPMYNHNYSRDTNDEVAGIIRVFNEKLAAQLDEFNCYLLDVYEITGTASGYADGSKHLDNHHLSNAVFDRLNNEV